jgi:prolyl-tRNA editing enzyme YbaK/EbsC (Cys-tRNA(Pro) deacylase)
MDDRFYHEGTKLRRHEAMAIDPSTPARSPIELRDFAAARGVAAELHPSSRAMPTVEAAASALGIPTGSMTKNIVWLVAGAPVLVIAAGLARIDDRALARHFAVGRSKVGLATPEQAYALAGFVVGTMPSFGHRAPLSTLIDTAVVGLDRVYGGTGDPTVLISLATRDLLGLTGGAVASVCK